MVDLNLVIIIIIQHCCCYQIIKIFIAGLGGSVGCAPTGDEEVAGSIPVGSATFFCGNLVMKYFLWSISPFTDARRAVVSFFSGKRICFILVNLLED